MELKDKQEVLMERKGRYFDANINYERLLAGCL
jgi:hypothetical protein